jgi:hypothetical protein
MVLENLVLVFLLAIELSNRNSSDAQRDGYDIWNDPDQICIKLLAGLNINSAKLTN